jgi:hypothetical protein
MQRRRPGRRFPQRAGRLAPPVFPVRLTLAIRRAARLPLCALLFSPHLAAAQVREPASEPFVHESWTVQDGLPVNSINASWQPGLFLPDVAGRMLYASGSELHREGQRIASLLARPPVPVAIAPRAKPAVARSQPEVTPASQSPVPFVTPCVPSLRSVPHCEPPGEVGHCRTF